ncbi:MAG: nitrate reductase associated protein [Oscillatoria sp. Prado101]|jgi:hypothetical protein|nr:nitrate reductase associated protein [Oscillatoria sp. Prado101]
MSELFQFEADFVDSLRCIPMQVRLNLDSCGVKLKLAEWNRFSQEEKQALVDMPAGTSEEAKVYRELLHRLVLEHTGKPATDLPVDAHPAWMDEATVPENVRKKAEEVGVTLTPAQWANLAPLRRFALIKLSRSEHENSNFLPALKEFGVV